MVQERRLSMPKPLRYQHTVVVPGLYKLSETVVPYTDHILNERYLHKLFPLPGEDTSIEHPTPSQI